MFRNSNFKLDIIYGYRQKRTLNSKKYGVDLIHFTHAKNTAIHSSTKIDGKELNLCKFHIFYIDVMLVNIKKREQAFPKVKLANNSIKTLSLCAVRYN